MLHKLCFKICIKIDFTLKYYYYVLCAFVTYISIKNYIGIVCKLITNLIYITYGNVNKI